jgi:hypothetical protein
VSFRCALVARGLVCSLSAALVSTAVSGQETVTQPLAAAAGTPRDPGAALDVARFITAWRAAWTRSDQKQPPFLQGVERRPPARPRPGILAEVPVTAVVRQVIHAWAACRQMPLVDILELHARVIPGIGSASRDLCPTTLLFDDPRGVADEGHGIDDALTQEDRSVVRALRDSLLGRLQVAAERTPGDSWIHGQRVRFLVDQQRWEEAATLATSCPGERWWCDALGAFVALQRGDVSVAAYAGSRAVSTAPDVARCELLDARLLLPPADTAPYAAIPCAARRDVDDRLWWLADPLFIQPGNERLAIHVARRVATELRAAAGENERYQLLGPGGAAAREMLLRYGWPSRARWVIGVDEAGAPHDPVGVGRMPIATAEYALPRSATLSRWDAVVEPFRALPEAWHIPVPPADWPREHAALVTGPVHVLESQAVIVRRAGSDHLVTAAHAPGGVDSAWLVLSRSLAEATPYVATVRSSGRVEASAPLTTAAVASLELRSSARTGWSRARWGTASAAIATTPDGGIGVSQPALTTPELPRDQRFPADWLAGHLLPSTSLAAGERVGVYWEVYGLRPGDTLEITIGMNRPGDAPGRLDRLLRRVRIGGGALTTSWRLVPEVDTDGRAAGAVVMPLGSLPSGPVDVTVEVRRRTDVVRSVPRRYVVR